MPLSSRCAAGPAEPGAGPVARQDYRARSSLQLLGRAPGGISGHARANAVDAAVAIKQIVGVERNDLPLRRDKMNAGALDVADAEIEAIEELHDGDAENVCVAQPVRHLESRQAAQEFGDAFAGVERTR